MATQSSAPQASPSLLDEWSPLLLLAAFFGIPGCAAVAMVLMPQLPRIFYGEANPFLFAAEIISLIGVVFLVFLLRFLLSRPSAPTGFLRNVLDFLAMSRWHPAAIAALALILILPQFWYLKTSHFSVFVLLILKGWRAFQSGDFRDELDRLIVAFQLPISGGVPLLFVLHMFTRWKPSQRWLPWLLIPVLIVGTAIGAILIGTINHFSH